MTMQGVTYTPGIDETELENLSYSEASELMAKRSHKTTASEFIISNIGSLWFWGYIFRLWLLLFVVSISAIIIKEKWCKD